MHRRSRFITVVLAAIAGGCSSYQYKEPPPELPPPTRTLPEIRGNVNTIYSRTSAIMDVSRDLEGKLRVRNSPYADRAAAWRQRCFVLHMKCASYGVSRDTNLLPDFDNPLGEFKRRDVNARDIDAEVDKRLDGWNAELKAVEQEFRELLNLLADTHGST